VVSEKHRANDGNFQFSEKFTYNHCDLGLSPQFYSFRCDTLKYGPVRHATADSKMNQHMTSAAQLPNVSCINKYMQTKMLPMYVVSDANR
jgi:hypothetical protein